VTKKWGGERAKQFFQKHTNSASKKVWEKNIGKKCEKCFLYSYEYPDQKMQGIKRAEQFFQKHKNSAGKKCWEKNLRKEERKKRFLYSHAYRYQKWGEIYALNNFSRNIRIVRAENI